MNRIAILRKERKLSQKELGAIIGVAQNTICNWENGKREPDYDSLKKMAFFFNCSTDYLLGQTSFGKTFVFDEETDPNLDWAGHPLAGKDKEKKPIPVFEDGLDDEQKDNLDRQLVELMKALTPDQKELLLAQLLTLTGRGK